MTTMSTIPTTMSAIAHSRYGESDALQHRSMPVPTPAADQVLIRVEAAALNPADVFMMRGRPRMVRLGGGLTRPSTPIRGTDVEGEVVAVGARVEHWRVGDRAFGEAASGSLAEYATASAGRIARIPDRVPATHAAASVMAALAARDLGELGVTDISLLDGRPSDWEAAGLQLEATPHSPADAECIDFLFFTHERHAGVEAAARQYLAWEIGLVDQLDDQERGVFRIIR